MIKKTILAMAPALLMTGVAISAAALTDNQLFEIAVTAVKNVLKDPYTAQFQDMYVASYTDESNYTICGDVNAKNSYGGYVGYELFYAQAKNSYISVKIHSKGSDLDSILDNLAILKACYPSIYTTTTTTTNSSTTTTTTIPDPTAIPIVKGWNLVGLKNGEDVSVTEFVSAHLGDIESVWTWTNANGASGWSVYLPNSPDGGESYASDKGFGSLSVVHFGEGFWVNANTNVTLP